MKVASEVQAKQKTTQQLVGKYKKKAKRKTDNNRQDCIGLLLTAGEPPDWQYWKGTAVVVRKQQRER